MESVFEKGKISPVYNTNILQMLISVIIPLYNKANSIESTINSLICQTYTDFEVVIINDGSTDNSLEIVSGIEDRRIRIINQQNAGVSAARNRGAKEAKSEYIFFLDADDYIYPDCLMVLMNLRNKYPAADLWCGNYEMVDNGRKKTKLSLQREGYVMEAGKYIWQKTWLFRIGSYMMKKEIFLEMKGFDERITIGEDFYFLSQFAEKYKAAYAPTLIMSYCCDNKALSLKKFPKEKYVEWYLDFNEKDKFIQLTFAGLIAKKIIRCILSGDISSCIAFLKKYYKYSFLMIKALVLITGKKITN